MQIITDQVYEFSKDNKPCATAKPGEVLQFNTQDCFSNRIPDENTTMADLDYTYGFANPAAGPVYIEGAEPGDVLVVDIYEVKVADEGIEVIVANGKRDNILLDLLAKSPDRDVVATRFVPASRSISQVKKWIAHSEGFAKGELYINEGAYEALQSTSATSLLPVGVNRVEGEFEKDDIVRIIAPNGEPMGVGRVACDSVKARQTIGRKGGRPIVHYDYLYLD